MQSCTGVSPAALLGLEWRAPGLIYASSIASGLGGFSRVLACMTKRSPALHVSRSVSLALSFPGRRVLEWCKAFFDLVFAAVPVTPREFCDCSGIRTRAARNTFSSDQHGQHQYNAFSRAYVVGFFLNIFSSCSQESVRSPETQREFGALTLQIVANSRDKCEANRWTPFKC